MNVIVFRASRASGVERLIWGDKDPCESAFDRGFEVFGEAGAAAV